MPGTPTWSSMWPLYDTRTTTNQKKAAPLRLILQRKLQLYKTQITIVYEVLQCHLIRELDEFYHFVDAITTPDGVGGDAAEDIFGGLNAVLELTWPQVGTKVCS